MYLKSLRTESAFPHSDAPAAADAFSRPNRTAGMVFCWQYGRHGGILHPAKPEERSPYTYIRRRTRKLCILLPPGRDSDPKQVPILAPESNRQNKKRIVSPFFLGGQGHIVRCPMATYLTDIPSQPDGIRYGSASRTTTQCRYAGFVKAVCLL